MHWPDLCFAVVVQAMHSHLIELGLPQCTSTVSQNAAALCSSRQCDHPDSRTDSGSAADQLLVGAAGYLTAVVQDAVALQALGGEQAMVQVLVSLLTACGTCR